MNLALIPLLPLISFAILILFGRRFGRWAPWVSLIALAGSLVLSASLFYSLLTTHYPLHFSWTWLSFGEHSLRMGFLADPLSVTMCLVVTGVGWLIMLYSIGYMQADPRFSRFFAYLSLFFSAMLTLVLADHFILLYIGWELVGLCSYLLISFWFEKESAANAGKKAFLTTRIGDLGLLAAILLIAKITGNLSFTNLEGTAAALGAWAPIAAVLIFWGAAGKSAQFPLHVWLPDAMEGPTPVSALIHAATMVAAGVYLVARTLPLFIPDPEALRVVAILGGITSFFAGTVACTQTDLKKVLAYSTISQLGLMMVALSCGSAFPGMFHLVTHAWFKALLFLGAGSVIHAVHHQEMTRMGGLWKAMPITAVTFLVGSLAMSGLPPFSGFWSKEEILTGLVHHYPAPFLWLVMGISGLTAFYISRAAILVFFGASRDVSHDRGGHEVAAGNGAASASRSHESPWVMTLPLIILSAGAAGVGLLGSHWTGYAFQHFLGLEAGRHEGMKGIQSISIAVAGTGILLAVARYGFGWSLAPAVIRRALNPIYRLVAAKYYVDELYERLFLGPARAFSRFCFSLDARVVDGAVNGAGRASLGISRIKRWIDEHWVDGAVNGLGVAAGRVGGAFRALETGVVQNYLLIAFGSGVAIVLFLMKGI